MRRFVACLTGSTPVSSMTVRAEGSGDDPEAMAHGNRSPSPSVAPLTYPGVLPERPVLFYGDRFVELAPGDLDVSGRHAVLAVGSNAGRARLAEKLAQLPGEQLVPVVPCEIDGVAVAFTALVASYGSIPYTAVPGEGVRSRTFVQFLDDAQLAVIDASEQPAYRRDHLTEARIELATGEALTEVWAYVCGRGAIIDGDGELVSLRPQAEVLALLAGWFPHLLPAAPADAVARLVADSDLRRRLVEALHAAGHVRPI